MLGTSPESFSHFGERASSLLGLESRVWSEPFTFISQHATKKELISYVLDFRNVLGWTIWQVLVNFINVWDSSHHCLFFRNLSRFNRTKRGWLFCISWRLQPTVKKQFQGQAWIASFLLEWNLWSLNRLISLWKRSTVLHGSYGRSGG